MCFCFVDLLSDDAFALPGADVTPQAPQASSFSMGMYMSSGAGSISSANHSRASSMAEETPLGYVPMLPTSMQHRQESLIDLDHSKGIKYRATLEILSLDERVAIGICISWVYINQLFDQIGFNFIFLQLGSIGGSSCSLTSGTPSMTNTGDFSHPYSSEFHLEKVDIIFTELVFNFN